ncbi:MAG: hypothetical protein AAGK47_01770 [Bacteroidota bacterium]
MPRRCTVHRLRFLPAYLVNFVIDANRIVDSTTPQAFFGVPAVCKNAIDKPSPESSIPVFGDGIKDKYQRIRSYN